MKINPWPLALIFTRKTLGTKGGLQRLGKEYGPIVFLLEDYSEKDLKHALWHVGQAWRGLIIIHALLLFIPEYKAWGERKAQEAESK